MVGLWISRKGKGEKKGGREGGKEGRRRVVNKMSHVGRRDGGNS